MTNSTSPTTTTATAHLNLRGDARQALGFYQSVFGGQLAIVSYADAHNVTDPAEADQVMWGEVRSDSGFRIMAYDVPKHTPWEPGANAFFVAVQGATTDDISGYWNKLADAATIVQPLAPSPWAPLSGMLTDRHGVTWVLSVVSPYQES